MSKHAKVVCFMQHILNAVSVTKVEVVFLDTGKHGAEITRFQIPESTYVIMVIIHP